MSQPTIGIITEKILTYPQGAEWMMGRKVKLIETYSEDGHDWWVTEINLPSVGARRMNLPEYVMDIPQEPVAETLTHRPKTRKYAKKTNTPTNTPETNKDGLEPILKGSTGIQCVDMTKAGNRCKGKPINGTMKCAAHTAKKGKKWK